MQLELTAAEIEALMIDRANSVKGFNFQSDPLYLKLNAAWVAANEAASPTLAEVEAGDARIAADHEALREHFYGDSETWDHENCGAECDGNPHS